MIFNTWRCKICKRNFNLSWPYRWQIIKGRRSRVCAQCHSRKNEFDKPKTID